MPHKRAKLSVRQNDRKQRGDNLAPQKDSLSNEPIPKGAARILNAENIREQYKHKKRKLEEDGGQSQGDKRRKLDADAKDNKAKKKETQIATKLVIKPGESIQHFNRRVEDDMRPLVKAAVQSSNAAVRNTYKAEKEARLAKKTKNDVAKKNVDEQDLKPTRQPPAAAVDRHADKAKEFLKHSSSAPRRLNDIAQAPPEFKRLPRGAASSEHGFGGKRDGVLSMAQKQMMEKEREIVITRYRDMKSRQRNTGDKADGQEE